MTDQQDENQRRVDDLRRDLQDGEDLSMAINLISDALHRRIDRARRSLGDLMRHDAESEPLKSLLPRMREVLGRFEDEVDRQRLAMVETIDRFQQELDDGVDVLEGLDG